MSCLYTAALLLLVAVCGINAVCQVQTIESNGYEYKRVTISGAIRVTSVSVQSQRSRSPCTLNASFGAIGPAVWVDNGCRAVFNICFETGTTITLRCESNNFNERRCNAGGVIRELTLKNQRSNSPCIENFSYRKEGSFIVVSKGCRADFEVGL